MGSRTRSGVGSGAVGGASGGEGTGAGCQVRSSAGRGASVAQYAGERRAWRRRRSRKPGRQDGGAGGRAGAWDLDLIWEGHPWEGKIRIRKVANEINARLLSSNLSNETKEIKGKNKCGYG